jgi:iron complex transport system substrate-binding protein
VTTRRLCGIFILGALVATGCGDDSGSDGTDRAEGAADEDTDGAWPVTVEHAFGETVIEERPERVVTLAVQWTDALTAMGVEPEAFMVDGASGETGPLPWQDLGSAEQITSSGDISIEQIASYDHDLILVTHAAESEDIYESLSDVAPTIGLLGDRQVDRWQDQVEVLGRILGEPDQAEQVVQATEGAVDDIAGQLPGLDGGTYTLVNYIPGDAIYVVADPEDGASEAFSRLGMEIAPTVLAEADGVTGRAELSFEQVDLLDADLLMVLAHDGDLDDLPGWSQLPAVESGAVAEMAFDLIVGLNTPTPLSLPFVLNEIRPALEIVAGD